MSRNGYKHGESRHVAPPTLAEYEAMGIDPPTPGRVSCLRCGKMFTSKDRKLFRLCKPCSEYRHSQARRNMPYLDFPLHWDALDASEDV